MRLTLPLCKINRIRMFKDHYKVQVLRPIKEYPIPSLLVEKNIKIWNIADVASPKPQFPIVKIPFPFNPPLPKDERHPDWKPKVCYHYVGDPGLTEGLAQAQLLTKTVVYEGLPRRILDLVGKADQPNQDELVKRAILLSHVWDGYQEKLPKIRDLSNIKIRPRREYGIRKKRRMELLTTNLVRLMEQQAGPEAFTDRLVLNAPRAINTTQKNDDLLQFDMRGGLAILGAKPLQPFANEDEVREVSGTELPNIYPLKYTIDFKKINLYRIIDSHPLYTAEATKRHFHTLFLYQIATKGQRTLNAMRGHALLAAHTFAVSEAKLIYGADVQVLPRPISLHCVQIDGNMFKIMAYQLNTTTLDDSTDSVRNMAWLVPDLRLFDTCEMTKKGTLTFENYNPEVYRQLLALYINGLSRDRSIDLTGLLINPNAGTALPSIQ